MRAFYLRVTPGTWSLLASLLTIALLPDQNESGEANEEHGSAHNRLPLIRAPVHFSKALIELNAIHWKQKEQLFAGITTTGTNHSLVRSAPSFLTTTPQRREHGIENTIEACSSKMLTHMLAGAHILIHAHRNEGDNGGCFEQKKVFKF